MKKIVTALLATAFLLANPMKDNISLDKAVQLERNGNKIDKINQDNKEFVKKFKRVINRSWGKVEGIEGNARVKFVLDTNSGRVLTYMVYKKEGNKKFIDHLRNFLTNSKKLRLTPFLQETPILELTISFYRAPVPIKEKIYRVYDKEKDMYLGYIKYLIEKKGYKEDTIQNHLNSKNDTFTKNMLFALYYDYKNVDKNMANTYYKKLTRRYPNRLKETIEGLYVSDWLLRQKNDKLILKLFPVRSCQFFKHPFREQCYYVKGVAKYRLGLDYKLELNIAQNYFKEAELIIKKEKHK